MKYTSNHNFVYFCFSQIKTNQMKKTILAAAVLFASCSKTEIVTPTTVETPTIKGVWVNDQNTLTICGGKLSWSGIVPYTPFPYVSDSNTIYWILDDSSKAPMYQYTLSKDTLYLYSLTIGTPNKMTFTKCK